jgi:hypothetical protein
VFVCDYLNDLYIFYVCVLKNKIVTGRINNPDDVFLVIFSQSSRQIPNSSLKQFTATSLHIIANSFTIFSMYFLTLYDFSPRCDIK